MKWYPNASRLILFKPEKEFRLQNEDNVFPLTSRNFFVIVIREGKKNGHIIDPRGESSEFLAPEIPSRGKKINHLGCQRETETVSCLGSLPERRTFTSHAF